MKEKGLILYLCILISVIVFGVLSGCSERVEAVNSFDSSSDDYVGAQFSASSTNVVNATTVEFTDLSTNGASSWYWIFDGGTPSVSTSQNPSVTYDTAGSYTVLLTSTNFAGSCSELKTDYIKVTEWWSPEI